MATHTHSAHSLASIVLMMYSPVPEHSCMRTHAIYSVCSPEVLQATALLSLLGVCWAQQPHPNTAACPTLPGNLREIPPLDTPPATPPRPSRHIAPTVSNGGSSLHTVWGGGGANNTTLPVELAHIVPIILSLPLAAFWYRGGSI